MPQEGLNIKKKGKIIEMKSSPDIDTDLLNKINSFDIGKIIDLFSKKNPDSAGKIENGLRSTDNIINLATHHSFINRNIPGRA